MRHRIFILLLMFCFSPLVVAQEQQQLEVVISGISCKFCVRNIEKNLLKLDGIKQTTVNLDKGIALIVMTPGKQGDVKKIKELIRNAGFTPGNVRIVKSTK